MHFLPVFPLKNAFRSGVTRSWHRVNAQLSLITMTDTLSVDPLLNACFNNAPAISLTVGKPTSISTAF
jgi:hypothetical protein